jgi:ATP-binding cassette subfamily B (MDR/TAP) protein 1
LLERGGAYATLVQMQQATGGDLVASPSSASLQCALTEKEDTEVQKTVNRKSLESPRDSEGGSKDDGHGKDERNLTENIGEWTGNAKAVGVAAPILVPGRAARGWKQMLSLRRAPKKTDGHSADAATSKKGKKQKEEDQPKVNASFARLAALNKPELPAAVGGLLGAGAMGLLFPIFAVTLSSLIALFYKPVDEIPSGARTWSLVFVGMGVGSLIAASLQSFCFNFMGQRLAKRVRVLMMQALLRQEVGWYDDDRNSSGVLSSKLATDAAAVRGQFGDTMGLLAQNLVTVLAAYIISGISSWRMMLVVTAMVPLMVFSAIVQTKLMLNASNEEEESFAVASATAAEAFSSVRTVAAFGMEGQVSSLYERSLKLPTQKSRKRAHFGGIGFAFSQFVLFGVYSLAFWYMGLEISRDNSSFENSMKAFFAIFLAAFGLAQAQAYFPDVAKGGAAVRRVFGIIDRKPSIDASDPGGIRPMETVGAIELQDVTFAYPQRPDAPVFSKFSLTVPAGKTVALVGESGSGKSTVVSLIERFYDPQQGAVLIDGINIKTLNLQWLRSQIGLVSQEPVLFNMTVADNIRYGRPQASMEDVVAAAKAANAHGFIEALPEGYHTRLGEGSIQLSGGQKQRVAIARAVVKDPKVLLLDEATSALDAESEHIVQEALDRLMVGRTTVVIAHRLSTVRDADAIAVVYKGRIVEQGTHAELLEKGGSYARLVAHQMRTVSTLPQ